MFEQKLGVHVAITRKVGDKEEVLMIRRSETDTNEPNMWEFPGGGMDEDNFYDGLKRECREEVNIEIENIKILAAYYFSDDGKTRLQLLCSAEYVSGEIKLSFEHSDYKWISLDSVSSLENKGETLRNFEHFLKTGERIIEPH